MLRLFFIFLLFPFFKINAQRSKPLVGNEPLWITHTDIDYANTSMDDDALDGYSFLGFEKQVNLAENCTYIRQCTRIISEAGVQNESQVSVSFDPTYQQLIFHSIKIIRGNTSIDQLRLSKMKTIQQEPDLDNFIYDGSLKAVLFLEDVRKGDIITYSYSVKGFNPIFKGKYQDTYDLQFSTPIYHLYYKLMLPNGRSVSIKNTVDSSRPAVSTTASATVYEWKRSNVKGLHTQDYLPSWYEVFPDVMISEFKTWKDVNEWALKLFPLNAPISKGLEQKINEIKQEDTSMEERVRKALRFVQDDIRYMGIEMGVHSHKPADPVKVFSQRFGDCKEKSYLLCCMLQHMGIEANPVLINTVYKKSIYNWLPSPGAFNHTTVRVKIRNDYYFFDPTIAFQRGAIKDIYYPDYECGFIINDTTTGISDIPFHQNGEVKIKENFSIPDMKGNAKLTVTTTYSGTYADDVRYNYKNSSNYEMLKDYKDFYASYFEKIQADSLVISDNDNSGYFTTKEYYSIDSFWSVDKGVKTAAFSSFVIQSILQKPKDMQRTMPFWIRYPAKYHESIVIDLPFEWDAGNSKENINCNAFMLNANFSYRNKKIVLDYDYESYKNHVTPQDAKEFFAALKQSDESQGYSISYNENKKIKPLEPSGTKSSYKQLLSIFLVLVLIISIVKITQRK
jgi:hypothetical protein